MDTPGLSTLSKRLKDLEIKVNDQPSEETFADLLLKKEEKNREKQRKKDLNRAFDKYHSGLLKHLGDVDSIFSNILLVIQYTVIFVEKNIDKFATTLNTSVTSDFKLDTALSLLRTVEGVPHSFTVDFLENSINFLVQVLLNTSPQPDQLSGESTQVLPIKSPPPPQTETPVNSPEERKTIHRTKSVGSKISARTSDYETDDDIRLIKKEPKRSAFNKLLTGNIKGSK